MSGITIGRLADQSDVSVETIRYYERRGLLEEPPRRPSGYRQYPQEAAQRLRFIRRAKKLGFTLEEIRQLLSLRSGPSSNRNRVRSRARAKIEDIEGRIRQLEHMKSVLEDLADACEQSRSTTRCPILEALEGPRSDDRVSEEDSP